jgi:hypothetical protein
VSKLLSPDALAQAIGIAPDMAVSGTRRHPTEATWELTAACRGDEDVAAIVDNVLGRFRAAKPSLEPLCKSHQAHCLLRIVEYVGNDPVGPGFGLSSDDIHLLSELDAFLDVDLYWVATSDEG